MAEINGIDVSDTALQIALCYDDLPADAKALVWSLVNSHMQDQLDRREDKQAVSEERRRYGNRTPGTD